MQRAEPHIKTYTIRHLSSEMVSDKMESQFSIFSIKKIVRKIYEKSCYLPTCPLDSINWNLICKDMTTHFLTSPKSWSASHIFKTTLREFFFEIYINTFNKRDSEGKLLLWTSRFDSGFRMKSYTSWNFWQEYTYF